jgi:hypothetical protein
MKCAMSALNSLLEGALEATIEGVGVKCVFVGEIIDLLSEPNQLEFITTMNYPQAEHVAHNNKPLVAGHSDRGVPEASHFGRVAAATPLERSQVGLDTRCVAVHQSIRLHVADQSAPN